MNLSKRMEAVVSMVLPQSKIIADVGCDHAYVSIALIQKKMAQRVIAMDVRKGPLFIAEKNVRDAGLHNMIEIRLSDGFEKLKPEEADTIIIAGMGGLLMISILEKKQEVWKNTDKPPVLILQPQSDLPKVRRYLYQNGYKITEEKMLVEDGKFYTILRGEVTQEKEMELDEVMLEYGQYNLIHHNPVLFQFLKKEKALLENIYDGLQRQKEKCRLEGMVLSEKVMQRLEDIRYGMARNEEGLSWFDKEDGI